VLILKGGVFMYYIGIDIAKFKHDCCIIEDNNPTPMSQFQFSNTHDGFMLLLEKLKSLDPKQPYKIGLESTGHYHRTLMNFLMNNEYHFAEFNPLIISRLADAFSLRRTKTDPIDASFITRILKIVDYKTYQVDYTLYELKNLTRMREQLIKDRSKYLIQITNVLDTIFPEYKGFFSSSNDFTKTSLYILRNYPAVDKMKTIDLQCFEDIKRVSRGSFNLSKYNKFITLTNTTIGFSDTYSELQLKTYIQLHDFLCEKIKVIELKIKSIISVLNPPTLSIPGIGVMSAAVILAEYNNINKFETAAQMLAFAGIEPSVTQSGTSSKSGHMVKHGSGYLRQTLMNLVIPLTIHNPVMSAYYYKKRNEGKLHRVASTHVVKKLLRYIFTLETNGIKYDPKLAK